MNSSAEICRIQVECSQNMPKNARNSTKKTNERIRLALIPDSCWFLVRTRYIRLQNRFIRILLPYSLGFWCFPLGSKSDFSTCRIIFISRNNTLWCDQYRFYCSENLSLWMLYIYHIISSSTISLKVVHKHQKLKKLSVISQRPFLKTIRWFQKHRCHHTPFLMIGQFYR